MKYEKIIINTFIIECNISTERHIIKTCGAQQCLLFTYIVLMYYHTHAHKHTQTNKRMQVNSSAIQRVSYTSPHFRLESCCCLDLYSMFRPIILWCLWRQYAAHCSATATIWGDRTSHWAYAKHIDTLYVLLTNTYNVYPRSTRLIIINIIMYTELSQYKTYKCLRESSEIFYEAYPLSR